MVIIARNKSIGGAIAFTNNSLAMKNMIASKKFDAVLLLGTWDAGFPDTSVKTTEMNGKNGLVIDSIKYTKRFLQFNTNFVDRDELSISKTRQKLARVINSQQEYLVLEFYRNNQWVSDGELFYLKNVVGKISYESSNGQRLTNSQQCLLEFTSYSAFFERPEKKRSFYNSIIGQAKTYPFHYPFTYDSAEGDLGQINNLGDVPCPFYARFSGSLHGASLMQMDLNKQIKLKDDVEVSDTQVFLIDTDTRTASIDGVNAFDKLTLDSVFFNLTTGNNTFKFLAGNNIQTNSVEISWTERYISI